LYFSFTAILLALVSLSVQADILQKGEDDIVKVEAVVKDRQIVVFPNSPLNWLAWGSWSSCSQTCGSGLQTRVRYCENEAEMRLFAEENPPKYPESRRKDGYIFVTTIYFL
jgi:hypothetical protein